MGEDNESVRSVLTIEGPEGGWDELITRIGGLGFHPVRCETIEDAERVLEATAQPVHCGLLPATFADKRLKRALKGLRKRVGRKFHLVAVGAKPEQDACKHLRSAGIHSALWEPFDETTLRFQLNRLTGPDPVREVREGARVPTRLRTTAVAGGRARDTAVYSLSASGAFLETPRACMSGATIELDLFLPSGALSLSAAVMFANVPGNLQRPNLPLGMGIRFDPMPESDLADLRDYIASRSSQLTV